MQTASKTHAHCKMMKSKVVNEKEPLLKAVGCGTDTERKVFSMSASKGFDVPAHRMNFHLSRSDIPILPIGNDYHFLQTFSLINPPQAQLL